MASGLMAIKEDQALAWNSLKQLENDFLMYGKYNVAQLQDIVSTVNGLQNRTMQLEKLLTGKDLFTLQVAHMQSDISGRMTFIHKMNLYVHSVLERQIRLYEWLLGNLKDLLNAIGILSTGHLPPYLFPPTILENITTNALAMVMKTHPNFVLAIKHITEYYDMKLATFGIDTDGNMIVAFPVFVQDHTSQPQTLYEIETVKVPIHDLNTDANSYSEVRYSKPYIAINKDYYIQLRIQELRMCKQIRHTYYCEELFLVKHKSKHICESAIFYKLSKEVVYSVCTFDYYYNTTVTPSVLDGGTHILLANMLSPKRLVCSQDLHMAHPVSSYPYVLVNRSLLCNCHLESGLTYLLESVGSCSPKTKFIMYFTINSAFNHYMSLFGLYENETLFPAIAGLATIAVESLNSFLQRKRNKAMASGLMAIKEDQALAWNSLKQLENDFLMYGKYNVAQLQDIVSTVNGLQSRTMQLEKLLTGKDLFTLQVAHIQSDISGRMTFIHKMNLYVHSVLERQIRLYE